ncbi:MAG: 2-polyprenyl-6-methoxyphenol hydroxylase-like oxidoreductase [Blastocatellia bacterium]
MRHRVIFDPSVSAATGRSRSHAIVIGGSLAGMLTARLLSEHFDHVTIIERDRCPEGPVARPGLSQARHVHVLLARGRMIVEELFPGVCEELKAAGAQSSDAGLALAWLTPAGWGIRFRAGNELLSFTRDLLDWTLRRRLKKFTSVRFMEGYEVTGLLADADRKNVTGISIRPRRKNETVVAEETNLFAELVVDASGRASKAPQWLAALGYPQPQETVINAHTGYASRIYHRPAGWQADWTATFSQAAPPQQPRAGILFPVEDNCWLVSLAGGGGDYPPTDEAGFLEFARSLPNPLIYQAISRAEPVSPIHGNRSTINRLRHYERLTRQPERFVALGDSVCAFNPVYGQGMSIAALGAQELSGCLSEMRRRAEGDLTGLAQTFQKRLAKINEHPWMMATSEDYRYHGTEGGTPGLKVSLLHRYMDQVIYLTTKSVPVRSLFMDVQQMLRPPAALFSPEMILRVAGTAVRRTFQNSQRIENREYSFDALGS